jgi:OOP family OmpA-OmpF porin
MKSRKEPGRLAIRKIIVASALATGGLLATTQASAQAFIGGSIGQSTYDSNVADGLITSGSVDKKDTGFKLFGGYMFNQNFGVEGAYVDLGKASYSGDFFGFPVTGGKVGVTGFNLAALVNLPVTRDFSVFGRVGMFMWDAKANDTTGGIPFSAKNDGSDVSYGLGIGYDFTRNMGVRAEWDRFKFEESGANLLSVGLVLKF